MPDVMLENPLIIALVGFAIAATAGFVWIQTTHKSALYTAVGIVAVTVVLTMLAIQFESEGEQIRRTLNEVADALESNDHERVYSYIHPNAVEGVLRAKQELPNYQFEEARVTTVKEISVNLETTPPTAIAEFNVAVSISNNGARIPVRRFVKVYFMKKDGKWMVRDYEHFDAAAGFSNLGQQ